MDPKLQQYLSDKYQLGLTDEEKAMMSGSDQRANDVALGQGMMEAANSIASGIAGRGPARPLFADNSANQSSDTVRSYIMNRLNERRGAAKLDQEQTFKAQELQKKLDADAADSKYKADMKSIEAGKLASDKEDKAKRQSSTDTQDLIKYRDAHDVTKQTNIVAPAFKKITTAAKSGTAAGDMSMIFGFMKLQDPNSTVREGEYASAKNAAGVPERIITAYNNALKGELLSPEQRADFVGRAKDMYDSQMAAQASLDEQVKAEAKNRGLDPNRVIINPWGKVQSEEKPTGSKPMRVMRAADLP